MAELFQNPHQKPMNKEMGTGEQQHGAAQPSGIMELHKQLVILWGTLLDPKGMHITSTVRN
jgi:hypothetical protein